MSTLLFLPLLALGFVVLVGTITAVTWLHLRRGPHVSVDNARIETQSWLRIPCLDALFEFPQRLPGMYRAAGTWIDSIILLGEWRMFRLGIARRGIASGDPLQPTWSRPWSEGSWHAAWPVSSSAITALTIGVVIAMIHFALIMRLHFS